MRCQRRQPATHLVELSYSTNILEEVSLSSVSPHILSNFPLPSICSNIQQFFLLFHSSFAMHMIIVHSDLLENTNYPGAQRLVLQTEQGRWNWGVNSHITGVYRNRRLGAKLQHNHIIAYPQLSADAESGAWVITGSLRSDHWGGKTGDCKQNKGTPEHSHENVWIAINARLESQIHTEPWCLIKSHNLIMTQ